MAEDDEVTIKRSELAAFVKEQIDAGTAEANMPKEEKNLRRIIGEVFDQRLGEFFTNADDSANGENDGGTEKGKGGLAGILGL